MFAYCSSVPAEAPDWLFAAPMVKLPVPEPIDKPTRPIPEHGWNFIDPSQSLDDIQDSICADTKITIAAGWGLQFSGRPSSCRGEGWVNCFSIDGEDEHASACFQPVTGRYKDFRTGECLTFFQLDLNQA